MVTPSLYGKHARYYDLIYHWKEYGAECAEVLAIANGFRRSTGTLLLDVACGTGKHLEHFAKGFSCTGVDASAAMLAVAKKRVPGARLLKQDMAKLSLKTEYDLLTCLFSSIGYMKTDAQLLQAFEGFAKHLKRGGVVLVEPWFNREQYRVGVPHLATYTNKEIALARMNVSAARGRFSVLTMHWLIGEQKKQVVHVVDKHELLMTPTTKLVELMQRAGLQAQFIPTSPRLRGLIVGVKP